MNLERKANSMKKKKNLIAFWQFETICLGWQSPLYCCVPGLGWLLPGDPSPEACLQLQEWALHWVRGTEQDPEGQASPLQTAGLWPVCCPALSPMLWTGMPPFSPRSPQNLLTRGPILSFSMCSQIHIHSKTQPQKSHGGGRCGQNCGLSKTEGKPLPWCRCPNPVWGAGTRPGCQALPSPPVEVLAPTAPWPLVITFH